jgi:hypothetical protein
MEDLFSMRQISCPFDFILEYCLKLCFRSVLILCFKLFKGCGI